MNRTLLIACFLLVLAPMILGQNLMPKVTPPSPNAASLGKYGEWPVDLSNGLIKIEIPIYTVKSRSLEVPISLSYHASGIKVSEVPSWAGLGWTLNAGGVVSRSILGSRDEAGHLGQIYMTRTQLDQSTNAQTIYDFLEPRAKGITDNESDRYSYNANGISGVFYYTTSQQMVQVPLTDNKIEAFTGPWYTITSDNGTRYIFDVPEETYNEATGRGAERTSWYLSKMISADMTDTIYFDYVPGGGHSEVVLSSSIDYNSAGGGPTNATGGCVYHPPSAYGIHHTGPILQKIRFANGYVSFTNLSGKLSEVKIFDNHDELKQSVKLLQSTWASRSMLDRVVLKDKNNTEIGNYQLTYNKVHTLPPYYGPNGSNNKFFGQDKWGYYNGIETNVSFQDIVPALCPNYAANRSVSEAHAQTGMLTELKYPTGGVSKFYYESNFAGVPVGGLRIKKVESYAEVSSTPVTRNYTYGTGYSAGNLSYLNNFQNYKYSVEDNVYCIVSCPPQMYNGAVIREVYVSNPIFPLSFNSNTAFYATVTETTTAGNIPLGKIDYEYEAEQDDLYPTNVSTSSGYGFISPKHTSYPIGLSWSRGPLKSKKVYKREANGFFTLIQCDSNSYVNYGTQTFTIGINVFRHVNWLVDEQPPLYANDTRNRYQYFDILMKTWSKQLKETFTKEYSNGVEIQKKTTFYHDAATLSTPRYVLTRSETINSKGETLKTIYKYPHDFSGQSPYSTMVTRNILTSVIDESAFKNSSFLKSTTTNYGFWGNNNWSTTATNIIVPKTVESKIGSNTPDVLLQYHTYGENGNILTVSKDADVKKTYIWGYNKMYPVAEITGETYTSILSTPGLDLNVIDNRDGISTDHQIRSEINKIRIAFPAAQVLAFTYQPLVGLTSTTDINGITVYYEYDSYGRLIHLRDKDRNILKKYCYNYKGQQENCEVNTAAQWVPTGVYRCVKNSSQENTGEQEREEKDINPFSTTYQNYRWGSIGYNPGSCPLANSCAYSNCDSQGEGYKCVYGVCVFGNRVNTYSYYDYYSNEYVCIYHYEYSDGSWSSNYYQYSQSGCYY